MEREECVYTISLQVYDQDIYMYNWQMTVVEAYVGGKKVDSPGSNSQLSSMLTSLLIEGIAQNTNGSVYIPTVSSLV